MLSNSPGKYRVRVTRPCLILGKRAEVGEELPLLHADAINAVMSGRCEEVDKLPKVDLAVPGANRI